MTRAAIVAGDTVRHFSNPASRAVVVAIFPAHPCGEFGVGSWLNGAFAPVDVIRVRWPSGRTEDEFASYWEAI